MTWFFVVLVTQMQNGLHEGFMWYDPQFQNKQECTEWVNNNPVRIISTLNSTFDNWEIHKTLCVREDKLKDVGIQPYVEGVKT